MSGKDLSREEREGLTMWGDAISAQVRDRGQVALHVRDDAPRSPENFHPVLLEARDVARLRALLNEAERRDAVSDAMSERQLEEIEKRGEAATGGPWFAHSAQKAVGEDQWLTNDADGDAFDGAFIVCDKLEMDYYTHRAAVKHPFKWRPGTREERKREVQQDRRNFEFIAHARQDIPQLLKEVRRSHAEAAELRKQAESAHLDAQNEQTRASDLEAENAELREVLRRAIAIVEVQRAYVDYDPTELKEIAAVLSPKQEEEEG